jgi:hypothetical protein
MRVVYSARSLALLTAPPLKAGGGQDQGRRSVIGRKGILSRIPLRIVVRASSRRPANPDCGKMTQQIRFWTSPKSINPNPGGAPPMFNMEQGYKINTWQAGTADGIKRENRRDERLNTGTGGRR